MKKRFLLMGLSLIIIFISAACNAGEKLTESEKLSDDLKQAKKSVEQYFIGMKEIDKEKMNLVLTESLQKSEDDDYYNPQSLEEAKADMEDFTYKYKEGKVIRAGKKVELIYNIRYDEGGESEDVAFNLIKENGKWLIIDMHYGSLAS